MRILFASGSADSRCGGERYLLYLGRALRDRGHQVVLWIAPHARMDELGRDFADIGQVVRSASYRNTYDRLGRSFHAVADVRTARTVAEEWRAVAPDVVHINKQNVEDGLDLLRAATIVGSPSVCTIHLTQPMGYAGAKLASLREAVARRVTRRYDGVLVGVLDNRYRELATFMRSEEGVRLVEYGVPDLADREGLRSEKRAELGVLDSELLVLALGRLVPQKRPLTFLDIAADTVAALDGVRFLWVGGETATVGGDALEREWDLRIREQGLDDAVSRLGWQPDVAPFLAAADVFVHVAQYEGLPIALLEAMSARLPVAVSDNLRRDMPFLAGADPIALEPRESWLEALRDRPALAHRAEAGRRLYESRFSFARMADKYEALYEEQISRSRSARDGVAVGRAR